MFIWPVPVIVHPALFISNDYGKSYYSKYTFNNYISSIELPASDSTLIYFGCNDGSINKLKYSDGAVTSISSTTIANASSQSPLLAVNPNNANMIVAVFTGYSGQSLPSSSRHVYLSIDGGNTWKDISGTIANANIPDMPLYSAVIDPNTTPNSILVSSDFGVFRTFDFGLTWHVLGNSLPHTHVVKLALDPLVNPSLVKTGTFGRSIWQRTLDVGNDVFGTLSSNVLQIGNILLQNNSQDTLFYSQVFNNGSENKFAALPPGQSNTAGPCFYSEVIVIRDEANNIVLAYVVNGSNNQVISISQNAVTTAKSNQLKNYPGLRSCPSVQAVNNFNVYNNTSINLTINWVAQNGISYPIAQLNNGASTTIGPVYFGGTFTACDSTGNLIAVYVATDAVNQSFTVTNDMVNFWN